MADWALHPGGQRVGAGDVNSGSSAGITITASGTINTKGSYAQIYASTECDADGLMLFSRSATTADRLLDVAIGAAASEVIVVPNLLISGGMMCTWLPIHIPAGTRLSARLQSSTASATISLQAMLVKGGARQGPPVGGVVAYGPDTSDSGGISLDPGTTANTKGAWSQIAAATSRVHRGLIVCLGNQAQAARSSCTWLIDIGMGAAASEQIIIPNVPGFNNSSTAGTVQAMGVYVPLEVPDGVRLAARAQCTITTATARLLDIALYGVG